MLTDSFVNGNGFACLLMKLLGLVACRLSWNRKNREKNVSQMLRDRDCSLCWLEQVSGIPGWSKETKTSIPDYFGKNLEGPTWPIQIPLLPRPSSWSTNANASSLRWLRNRKLDQVNQGKFVMLLNPNSAPYWHARFWNALRKLFVLLKGLKGGYYWNEQFLNEKTHLVYFI